MVLTGYQSKVSGSASSPVKQSAPSLQIAGQNVSSLAQKLGSFSNAMIKNEVVNSKMKAAENASRDVAVYKEKLNEIQIDSNLTQAEKEEKANALRDSHEYDGWGYAYKQAYKTQFDASYTNTVTSEAATMADLASSVSGGSSANFMNTWSSYTRSVIKAAPTDSLAAVSKMTLDKHGASRYKTLANAEYKKWFDTQKKSYEDVSATLEEDYKSSYAVYDKAGMDRSILQFKESLASAVNFGFITAKQADVRMKFAGEDATIGRFKTDVKYAVDNNMNPAKAIQNIYQSKEFRALPLKKQEELMKDSFAQIKEKQSRIKEAKTMRDNWEQEHQEATYKETLENIFKGGIKLSDINHMEVSGDLSSSDADRLRTTLSNGGIKFSDQQQLTWYSLDANLINSSENEIYSDSYLSWKDKTALLEDRRKKMGSSEYKWTTTQNGIEGRKRIKRLFGFHEGTMMAKMDINNKTQQDYNAMMDKYFDHISSLPEGEQSSQAKLYADELISAYNNDSARIKEDKEKNRREGNQKKAEEAYKKYSTGFTMPWTTLKSKEEFVPEWLESKKLQGVE